MCQSASFLLTFITIVLVPKSSLQTAPCFDEKAKQILNEHKVTADITTPLDGKVFIDIWATEYYAEVLDCSISKYSVQNDVISVDIHSVEKTRKTGHFTEKWTKKGEDGIYDSNGEYKTRGSRGLVTNHYTELIYVFYVDDNAIGYVGCGKDPNGDYVKMSISVVKDKQEDSEVLESLAQAEAKMKALESIIPSPMVKLPNQRCPQT